LGQTLSRSAPGADQRLTAHRLEDSEYQTSDKRRLRAAFFLAVKQVPSKLIPGLSSPLPLNSAARHYFDKLLAGNRAVEEKLAYYRQMTVTAPRRYLKRFRLK
jgi:hypothetical protein